MNFFKIQYRISAVMLIVFNNSNLNLAALCEAAARENCMWEH